MRESHNDFHLGMRGAWGGRPPAAVTARRAIMTLYWRIATRLIHSNIATRRRKRAHTLELDRGHGASKP